MSDNEIKVFVDEMIGFLREWDLWEGTCIYAGGMAYCCGVDFGVVEEPCPRESGLVFCFDCALFALLNRDELAVRLDRLGPNALHEVFSRTDILSDHLLDEYGVLGAEDLLPVVSDADQEALSIPLWDPMEFDTFEDYVKLTGAYEFPRVRELGGGQEFISSEIDVSGIWDALINEAKLHFLSSDEPVSLPELAASVKAQFSEIFTKHGLEYDFDDYSTIRCELKQ